MAYSTFTNAVKSAMYSILPVLLILFLTACEESGGNSAVDPNEGADSFVTEVELDFLQCSVVRSELDDSLSVQCIFLETQYPLSMSQFIEEVNDLIAPLDIEINDGSRIWIESRGSRGGLGADFTAFANPGHGGEGGYARMATTVGEILDNLLFDGDSLYILIGQKGAESDSGGGGGGSSSVVTGKDLPDVVDVFDPEGELVLLISGGGGGGGASSLFKNGRRGGDGGDSISTVFNNASDSGASGNGGKKKGRGGNGDGNGNGGDGSPNDGTGGIGGYGGLGGNTVMAGWGIDLEWTSGTGGNHKNGSNGAGGGGGFGGGGGSNTTASSGEDYGDGAGGGGSWARISTVENSFGRFLGKDNMPVNDNNGTVVMTMETFSISN